MRDAGGVMITRHESSARGRWKSLRCTGLRARAHDRPELSCTRTSVEPPYRAAAHLGRRVHRLPGPTDGSCIPRAIVGRGLSAVAPADSACRAPLGPGCIPHGPCPAGASAGEMPPTRRGPNGSGRRRPVRAEAG
jgi:hypothetical protein